MSDFNIDAIDAGEDINLSSGSLHDSTRVNLADCEDADQIIRTRKAALPYITPDIPHSADLSLKGRVTIGAPELTLSHKRTSSEADMADAQEAKRHRIEEAPVSIRHKALTETAEMLTSHKEALENIQTQLEAPNPPEPKQLQFPNLALAAVLAGLQKEQITNDRLNKHIKEAEKHQKDIDLLLDLSSELTALKGEKNEIPEKLKTLFLELRERGIDLWKGEEGPLSKEQIAEIKHLSSAQVDKIRSNLQILFTTKIQVLVQAIGAILECVKDMLRNDTRLKNKALTLPGH